MSTKSTAPEPSGADVKVDETDPAAPAAETVQMNAAPVDGDAQVVEQTTFVPDEGPSVENPAVVRASSLASAGSTADVPSVEPSVILADDDVDPDAARAKAKEQPEDTGRAVDAEGVPASRVLVGEYDPAKVNTDGE